VETTPLLVVKSDESRQAFDIEKLKRGIIRACEKRPVTIAQIDAMADNIHKQLQNSLDQEVSSMKIGELVMEQLKKVDEVAYVRFASVYRQFADLTHFIEFIKEYDNKR
jgi:transcriptional repressor NrdR